MILSLLEGAYRWRLKNAIRHLKSREKKYAKIQQRSHEVAKGVVELETEIQSYTSAVISRAVELRQTAEKQLDKLDDQ